MAEKEIKMVAPKKARMQIFYRGFWAYAYIFSLLLQAGVAASLIWPKHPLDATIFEEEETTKPKVKIVKISYDELPPPPSLMDSTEAPPEGLAEGDIGDAPMPVPDELAERDTMTDTEGVEGGDPLGEGVVIEDNVEVGDDASTEYIEFVPFDKAPQFINKEEPIYPAIGREGGVEGVVNLMVYVGGDGKVKNVIVTGPMQIAAFNEAAVEAAYKCTFTPATSGGRAIGVWLAMPVDFHLK